VGVQLGKDRGAWVTKEGDVAAVLVRAAAGQLERRGNHEQVKGREGGKEYVEGESDGCLGRVKGGWVKD
jgi:hypothetical protein